VRLYNAPSLYKPDSSSCSISRKCNFRKHLQGHKRYRPDMELEEYWVRGDHPHSGRIEGRSRPSKQRVATKVESPPAMSSNLVEPYQPIKVPQLYAIGALVLRCTCLDLIEEFHDRYNFESLLDALPCLYILAIYASGSGAVVRTPSWPLSKRKDASVGVARVAKHYRCSGCADLLFSAAHTALTVFAVVLSYAGIVLSSTPSGISWFHRVLLSVTAPSVTAIHSASAQICHSVIAILVRITSGKSCNTASSNRWAWAVRQQQYF
jgi:hypothetical protein